MGMVIFMAIGPKAEALATEAGRVTEVPVGYDAEFEAATFDSDSHDDQELEAVIVDALIGIDPEWWSHLRVAE